MKKIGIVTIIDNNYGNRLQNYAVQETLKNLGFEVVTIRNNPTLNKKKNFFEYVLRNIKFYTKSILYNPKKYKRPYFKEFNKNINFNKRNFNWFLDKKINNKFDYFVVGSDQVWNPHFGRLTNFDLLSFASPEKRISLSASFAIEELPDDCIESVSSELPKFNAVSVREEKAKEIINKVTNKINVKVLVDPTMLLDTKAWDKVSKKPKNFKNKKYILIYFLGQLSPERKKIIEKIAKVNDCDIIDIFDKNSKFYYTGPSEFIYLEKNAFLICTDSFHSTVFAIIYNRPFVVFERDDCNIKMNSRLETLLKKFDLNDRVFTDEISDINLKCNFEYANKIIKKERKEVYDFLKKSLKIKEGE